MGRTYVNWEDPARDWKAETREFAAVPPDITTTEGEIGVDGLLVITKIFVVKVDEEEFGCRVGIVVSRISSGRRSTAMTRV